MTERLSAVVGARISEFKRKMAEVKAIAKTVPNTITVKVKARTDAAQKSLDELADTLRTFQTVSQSMGSGALLAMSPASVPLLATAVAAMASLGPMVGVISGGALGMASAFGAAGVGVAGFASVAVPTLSSVAEHTKDVMEWEKKYQKALKEGNKKDAAKALLNIEYVMGSISEAQQKAVLETKKFLEFYDKFTSSMEKPVLDVFVGSMEAARNLLKALQPAIKTSIEAISNLFKSFNQSLKADDVKNIIKWMNTSAAPALTALGKSAGYLMRGFLNILAAFNPLAVDMQNGLLGMTKRFSEWTAGLSKSDKFQAFIDYVKENGPKLLSIFGNITMGLVGMFTAFAPMSADMMTGLQNLTQRFKQWGQTLSENKSFQEFASYVRENAPQVLSLIGNLTDFLINLAVGMAPLGSEILKLVNGFLQWSNGMMEAHPWLKKIAGAALVTIGMFKMLVPPILAARALFSGFGGVLKNVLLPAFQILKTNVLIGLKMMGKSFMGFVVRAIQATVTVTTNLAYMTLQAVRHSLKFIGRLALMGAKYAWLGVKAMASALRIAASWFIALGPVGWVIATVIGLVALIIANWDKVKAWTLKAWSAVSKFVSESWSKIWSWTREKASAIANTVREKFQQAKQNVQEKMTAVWNTIKSKWASIKSTVTSKVGSILSTIRSKFQEAVTAVREKMNAAKEKVTSIWESIQEFFDGIDLYESGKAIIQSAIDGLSAMKSKITGKVEEIAGAVRAFWPFSPAKEGPLSDIHRMDFSGPIGKSIQRAKKPIRAAMNDLAMTAKPQVAFDGAFNANINADYEKDTQPIVIQSVLNGRVIAEETYQDISELQTSDYRMTFRKG